MSRLVLPFLLLAAVTACDDNPATQPSQPSATDSSTMSSNPAPSAGG